MYYSPFLNSFYFCVSLAIKNFFFFSRTGYTLWWNTSTEETWCIISSVWANSRSHRQCKNIHRLQLTITDLDTRQQKWPTKPPYLVAIASKSNFFLELGTHSASDKCLLPQAYCVGVRLFYFFLILQVLCGRDRRRFVFLAPKRNHLQVGESESAP